MEFAVSFEKSATYHFEPLFKITHKTNSHIMFVPYIHSILNENGDNMDFVASLSFRNKVCLAGPGRLK